jgi:hypothetical protein
VALNDAPIPQKTLARYVAQGAEPVSPDFAVSAVGPLVVTADLIAPGPIVRHDHDKLGRFLCAIADPDGREPEDGFQSPAGDDHDADRIDPVAINLSR